MAWNLYGKSREYQRESCRSRFESHSSLELIENNERREKKILIIETPFLNGEVDNTPLMICGSPISRKSIIPLDILRPSLQRSNNLHFMLVLCDRYDSNIVHSALCWFSVWPKISGVALSQIERNPIASPITINLLSEVFGVKIHERLIALLRGLHQTHEDLSFFVIGKKTSRMDGAYCGQQSIPQVVV